MNDLAPAPRTVQVIPLTGIPLVEPGDPLASLIEAAVRRAGYASGDILAVTHKVISKAEGQIVALGDVRPSDLARSVAAKTGKDPALVQVILDESRNVLRAAPGVLITEHRLGFISANSAVDRSNVPGDRVALLPEDPDASAARLRVHMAEALGEAPPVLITDSHGRPWRIGTVGVAVGAAGLPAVESLAGTPDLYGRELVAALVGTVDALASAAALVMGEAGEGIPAVLIRGFVLPSGDDPATDRGAQAVLRSPGEDLFR